MIEIIGKMIDKIKFYKWSEDRKKHLSPSSKEWKRNLSIVPYEANYLHQIDACCKENRNNFKAARNDYSVTMYLFRVTLVGGRELDVFPYTLKEREIVFKREQKELDGFHSVLTEEIVIKLYDIDKIYICYNCDEFEAKFVEKPMYGFKAITEERGKLLAHGIEYKIGIPQIEEVRNPYMTDFQDCYLHFCTTMECVLRCPGGTDYLKSQIEYNEKIGIVTRLFKVKAEEHCVQKSGDWWVTNKLTVMEEITPKEIVSYFQSNPIIKEEISEELQLNNEFWNTFKKVDIPPYREAIY